MANGSIGKASTASMSVWSIFVLVRGYLDGERTDDGVLLLDESARALCGEAVVSETCSCGTGEVKCIACGIGGSSSDTSTCISDAWREGRRR